MKAKTKYSVRDGTGWVTVKKARQVRLGFLEYELHDGTVGLAKPGTWKAK